MEALKKLRDEKKIPEETYQIMAVEDGIRGGMMVGSVKTDRVLGRQM